MKQLILCLAFIGLCLSCKKDTKVEAPAGPTDRYKALTSHYWFFKTKWYDTTDYGKAHPELIPLPTSINALPVKDSCAYYSCSEYNKDGYSYSLAGNHCSYPCSNVNVCRSKDYKILNSRYTYSYKKPQD